MKKIFILVLFLIPISYVKATESKDITKDSVIEYKWYKYEKDIIYFPKKDNFEGYTEESNNTILSSYISDWKTSYCSYNPNNYLITKRNSYVYSILHDTMYIKLTNFTYDNNLNIYIKANKLSYEVISYIDDILIIKLTTNYPSDQLWFYITDDNSFDILTARDLGFTMVAFSKHIDNQTLLFPDKTWLNKKTKYNVKSSSNKLEETDFVILKNIEETCRHQEIYSLRYKYNKVYYDDEYHDIVDGYFPDLTNYRVIYKGKPIIKEVPVIKEKKVYVPEKTIEYIEKEKIVPIEKVVTKVEYKNKEIIKIPKMIYYIITIGIGLIIILIIKICRLKHLAKNVETV